MPQTGLRGDYVCLTVRDTGRGMDEATMAHAFEPFFTTKGVGKGTGLGLTLAHCIAVEHGGEVVLLRSRPGETVFQMRVTRELHTRVSAENSEPEHPDQVIAHEKAWI